ncbi:MAG: adenosylhomocysteinase [Clostridiales bacterium]|nr:adenosylhomocysteinase [Clostridiales bacterium]
MYASENTEIKDLSLAPSGRDKIDWVIPNMPVLRAIERRFAKEKPFSGMRAAISIHLEAKTAYFANVLRSGGAEVFVTGCNPLSTQDDVAAALAADGFAVNAFHGASPADYERHLVRTLSCRPDFIVDDGGDLLHILHTSHPEFAKNLRGGCEETTTGVIRMRARADAGELNFPMIAVNDANSKHLFDNRYGTGQSVWDAIMHTTNLMVTGKTVVVAGYGFCGKGVAKNARAIGANVIVTEVDPHAALEACLDGCRVMPMEQAAPLGDIFITVTGCRDVITKRHFELMKDNAILCNAGHFDVEVNVRELRGMSVSESERKPNIRGFVLPDGRTLNVLGEGRLVNLAAGNGHPAEIMDMSFSLQCLCCEYVALHSDRLLPRAVTDVPPELDREVARIKLSETGVAIDELTEAQKKYLASW